MPRSGAGPPSGAPSSRGRPTTAKLRQLKASLAQKKAQAELRTVKHALIESKHEQKAEMEAQFRAAEAEIADLVRQHGPSGRRRDAPADEDAARRPGGSADALAAASRAVAAAREAVSPRARAPEESASFFSSGDAESPPPRAAAARAGRRPRPRVPASLQAAPRTLWTL